ncbi:isochorismatase family cysteine hydrolase [Fusibacter sp. JL298sf-3]
MRTIREQATAFEAFGEGLKALPELDWQAFSKADTAVVFVDVVRGFVDCGALQSERAQKMLPAVKSLDEITLGYKKLYFVDAHPSDAEEFGAYPLHCVSGTEETAFALPFDLSRSEVTVVEKNSVNGFFAPAFQKWLKAHPEVTRFVVAGLVTDICVMQFALTLKAYFNQQNVGAEIAVPVQAVETFHLEATHHYAELMQLFALYNMQMNGIALYR